MTFKEKPVLPSSSSGVKTCTLKVKDPALIFSHFWEELTHVEYSFDILPNKSN